jgi:hypothetical protein
MVFFRVSDRGFIGEIAFSLREFSAGGCRGRFVVGADLNLSIEDFVLAVVS